MTKYNIEFRKMSGGGNQLFQPYLPKEIKKQYKNQDLKM